jgi:hypothetical protein
LYYGITFKDGNGNVIDDLVINGDESGYMFRGPAESAARLHKDTVVIHLCGLSGSHGHPDGTTYPPPSPTVLRNSGEPVPPNPLP